MDPPVGISSSITSSSQLEVVQEETVELSPPEISVSPKHHQYYEGEKVQLSCTAKIKEQVNGYRFFDKSGSVMSQVNVIGFWSSSLYVSVQKEKNETFSCEYWKWNASEEVRSQRSEEITLEVTEAPQKPSLSLNQALPRYTWGDHVTLVCSAPPGETNITEFQYFGDRQTIQAWKSPKDTNTTDMYNLNITAPKDTGNFMCAYIQFRSGRNVRSKKSDPVFIEPAGISWIRIMATGGAFFTINGLIFLITHYYFLPKVSQRNDCHQLFPVRSHSQYTPIQPK
ncbi:uncharacterized protein LOC125444375 [Sphaerodactylus townsendi]|uniref:uncharacterized protein LOC125444375 n=1 Tax=Sphaerodactylus townsendi TaxID=933632 RepID=UPI002026573D|nr:uncharacterized protein LOC125444375 [Sphaerodactylus townsendi]